MNARKTAWKWLLAAGTFYPIVFVLVFIYLGLMQPSYVTMTQPISDLELGPDGWVQHLNFIVLGLCCIAFAFGFYRAIGQFAGGKWLRTTRALIGLGGIGYIMGGLFTYDPRTKGILGILHGLGYVLMTLSLLIALFIVGSKFLQLPVFRKSGVYSLVTLSLVICILVFQLIPAFQNVTSSIGGLLNRSFLIISCAWYVAIGDYLLALTNQTS